MDDEKMRELILDYLDGNLTGELKDFVSKHIQKTDKWQVQYEQLKELTEVIEESSDLEPPLGMKSEFEAMLASESFDDSTIDKENEDKVVSIHPNRIWLQIAASVVLVIGAAFIGFKISNTQNQKEIAALRQEMETTKQLVLISLENQSASSRLNAVNVSNKLNQKDDEIVNALISTLNNDLNANVRIAAMEALSKFSNDETVRNALIKSLSSQDSPVVQIALINLMVALKEEGARESLQEIVNNENIESTVRDEANYGLLRL